MCDASCVCVAAPHIICWIDTTTRLNQHTRPVLSLWSVVFPPETEHACFVFLWQNRREKPQESEKDKLNIYRDCGRWLNPVLTTEPPLSHHCYIKTLKVHLNHTAFFQLTTNNWTVKIRRQLTYKLIIGYNEPVIGTNVYVCQYSIYFTELTMQKRCTSVLFTKGCLFSWFKLDISGWKCFFFFYSVFFQHLRNYRPFLFVICNISANTSVMEFFVNNIGIGIGLKESILVGL